MDDANAFVFIKRGSLFCSKFSDDDAAFDFGFGLSERPPPLYGLRMKEAINQLINQATNKYISQSINESIDQLITKITYQ